MLKRMLALLLVLAMVLTVLPIGVLADEETTTETTETTTEATEEASEESSEEASTEASTEAPIEEAATEFALAVQPESHSSVAGATVLNLYLTASADTTIGSYQLTIAAAEGITFTYAGDATLGENNVLAWVDLTGAAPIAVGTTPLLLGKLTVTGTYTAGTSIVLSDVEVGETGAAAQTVIEPTYGTAADNSDYHAHGADVAWTAWTATDDLPATSGYYYLTGDVVLADQVRIQDAENVTLCLNGYNITAGDIPYGEGIDTKDRIYNVQDASVLTICDCTAHTDAEGNYVAGKLTGASQGAIMIPNMSDASFTCVVNIYDGIFTENNQTENGAAILAQSGGTVNVYGGEISGNSNTASGAGLYVGSNGSINVYGGEISGNSAKNYAGIYVANKGTLNMSGGKVINNTAGIATTDAEGVTTVAGGYGAGIGLGNSSAVVRISGGEISGNSGTYGGGIYNYSATLEITGGEITGNTITRCGGGIYSTQGSVTIDGADISNNVIEAGTTNNQGGGLYLSATVARITNTTINGNSAPYGGGIYLSNDSQLYMENVSMTENSCAKSGGMALSVYGSSDAVLKDCTIVGNTATTNSGVAGVYVPNSNATLRVEGATRIWDNLSSSKNQRDIWLQSSSTTTPGYAVMTVGTLTEGAQMTLIDNGGYSDASLLVADEYADYSNWSTGFIVPVSAGLVGEFHYDAQSKGFKLVAHDHDDENTWTPIGLAHDKYNTTLPSESGHYYLVDDIAMTGTVTIKGADVTICLNGHTITGPTTNRALRVLATAGTKLTICDCTAHTDADGNKVAGTFIPGTKNAGAAVYTENVSGNTTTCEVIVKDIIIDGKGATFAERGHGICILTSYTTLEVDNVVFRNLDSSYTHASNAHGGAAISLLGTGITASVKNSRFENNTANVGSAIWNKDSSTTKLTIEDCVFEGNRVRNTSTAAVDLNQAEATLTRCSFINNTAVKTCSALRVRSSKTTVTDCVFTGNNIDTAGGTAGDYVGAIYVMNNAATLTLAGKTIITDNYAGGVEVGVFLQNSGTNLPQISLKDLHADADIHMNTFAAVDDINTLASVASGDVVDGNLFYLNNRTSYIYDEETAKLVAAAENVHADHTDYPTAYGDVEWVGVSALPTEPGYYYLTSNIQVTSRADLDNIGGEIVLCLNGYTISCRKTYAFRVTGDSQLTICDCTAHTDEDGVYHAGRITGGTNYGAILMPNMEDIKNEDGSTTAVINGATVELYDGILTNNSGTTGGAILVQDSAIFNMYGGLITGNTATEKLGGAFYIDNSIVNIFGGEISYNHATTSGGAFRISGDSVFTMTDAKIIGNSAESYAGAISASGGVITLENVIISGNSAKNRGAISVAGSELTLTNCQITDNTAADTIGALYADGGSNVVLDGVTITGNTCDKNGAVYIPNTATTLTIKGDTVITGNFSESASQELYFLGEQNIYLRNNAEDTSSNPVLVLEELGENAQIGVTVSFTGNSRDIATTDADYTAKVFSDRNDRAILADAGYTKLTIYPQGATEQNPINLTADLLSEGDHSATVTVPAGQTYYFNAYRVNGMIMTINGGEEIACVTDGMMYPYAWTITNDGDEDAEYVICVGFPEGHQMNPVVIDELNWYYGNVSQVAGNSGDYYYYSYTAVADGTVTFYFTEVPEGYVCDIVVNNKTTSQQRTLQNDGVDNYGMEVTMDVKAGDEIVIQVAAVQDADGNYYPAAEMTWCGNFTYPVGTEQNPVNIEWAWDDAYVNASASVTVGAGQTLYFNGQAGMILTVDGVETEMNESGVFTITNSGDAEATYAVALATPVGAMNNPEVIEDMTAYTDSNSLEADASYYYIWTATEGGTVTLDVTDGANITVDKLTYSDDSEWPISEQFVLAEPTADENGNYTGWTVQENLVIEVVAGQQLKIQVNALTDWSTWSTPAIEYTLTGSFVKNVEHNLVHIEAVEPGCHYTGNIEHWYCTDCDTVWQDAELTQITNHLNVILPATGSENVVHFEAVAPGCHYTGNVEYWYCADCQGFWTDEACTQVTNSKSVVLPALESTATYVEAVEGDCQTIGHTEYWYCETCEQVWTDEALTQLSNLMNVKTGYGDHNYVDGTCSVCGEQEAVEDTTVSGTATLAEGQKLAPAATWTAPADGYVTITLTTSAATGNSYELWANGERADGAVGYTDFVGTVKMNYAVAAGDVYTLNLWSWHWGNFANNAATVDYSFTFSTEAGGEVDEKDEYEVSQNTLVLGENNLTMLETAYSTIYAFTPTETGTYTFTANVAWATVGVWGNFDWNLSAPEGMTNTCEWTCTAVGQSVYIGVSDHEGDFVLTVAKTAEYNPIVYTEVEYENKATLSQFVIPEGATLGAYVDVSTNPTAVLGEDGYYHLNSVDGPILLIDLDYMNIVLSDKLDSAIPTMYLYTTEQLEDGTYIKYSIGNAILEYEAVMDADGYYPVTEDIILFYKDYATAQGVWSFNAVEGESAWMYCMRTITLPEAPELIKWFGVNTTLGGALSLNFALDTNQLNGTTGNYIVLTRSYADDREDHVIRIDQADWTMDGSFAIVSYTDIAAKEMSDVITAVVYNADDQVISETKSDSIASYALRMLDKESVNTVPVQRTLYVDMLNYGAAAQNYFGYATDDLANADLTAAQAAWATESVTISNSREMSANCFGTNLQLENEIILQVAFAETYTEGMYVVATFTDHYGVKKEQTLDVTEDSGYVIVSVTGMAIADYEAMVTCRLYNAEGTELGYAIDSMESYVARNATKLGELGDAIMKLGASGYAYFHS